MRVLVTGAAGFVGGHVVRDLLQNGYVVCGTDTVPAAPVPGLEKYASCDIRDGDRLSATVSEIAPDACIHLAGLPSTQSGWEKPEAVFAINVLGTVNLIGAFRRNAPAARLLVVGSAQVYGTAPRAGAVTEEAPFAPENVYAVSKAAADNATTLLARHHGIHAVVARPYNHIGPGQSADFVVASLARQVRDVLDRRTTVIKVGNLDTLRDFTDVRDVARAYRLLIERGKPGLAYNIASGRLVAVRRTLEGLCEAAGIQPEIVTEQTRFRKTDDSLVLDTSRIARDAGWKPEIPLATSLRDILAGVKDA